jgi:dTDP-4-amino-4,6-dideoxygalactose transaminase
MFYILLESQTVRAALIAHLKALGIMAVFHYIPLNSSPMGRSFHSEVKPLSVTENMSERLLRLPCYYELTDSDILRVVAGIKAFFNI